MRYRKRVPAKSLRRATGNGNDSSGADYNGSMNHSSSSSTDTTRQETAAAQPTRAANRKHRNQTKRNGTIAAAAIVVHSHMRAARLWCTGPAGPERLAEGTCTMAYNEHDHRQNSKSAVGLKVMKRIFGHTAVPRECRWQYRLHGTRVGENLNTGGD